MPEMKLLSAGIFLALLLLQQSEACTTFVVGKKATKDGSVMCTHTNDGGGTTDPRLVKIPARNFGEGALRPIWASPENYPRYVGYERQAIQYFPELCEAGSSACKEFTPIGYIPQVSHTYSYFETTYGIMNEMQVGIGESTCSGVFAARAVNAGGKALLSVDQLSQIAMERASTAREAVSIMGKLAEQYGFYGESASFEGGSESLLVIDPDEGWVFHILADPSGSSAIWVAARVPDDSVAVVANMFSIREVNLTDTANFLGRADMWEIAEKNGLWKAEDPKDFTATFSDGEYAHKYYSGRRMWGVFRLLAASAGLPAEYGNLKADRPYPFAVPVDKPISPQDAMAVLRDWYNGTEYSTSDGIAAGPFGTPDRYSNNAADNKVEGNWERTIALFRSSDTFVVQARAGFPNELGGIVWYGAHAAHGTTFVPVAIGMTAVPDCLAYGWQGVYNASTAFWANRNVENLAQAKFSYMIEDIRDVQKALESAAQALVDDLSETLPISPSRAGSIGAGAVEDLTSALTKNAVKAVERYTTLLQELQFKYADGYINTWKAGHFSSSSAGYPVEWLEAVGYSDGPPPPLSGPDAQPKDTVSKRNKRAVDGSCSDGLQRCITSCPSGQLKGSERMYKSCVEQCLSNC